MDLKEAKLTRQGKPIEGDPEPGKYYRLEVPEGTDVRAAAKELKKQFPKSYFVFRSPKSAKPESEQKGAKAAKNLTPET